MLDYSTIEVSNQMFDALLAADDDRLTTAGKLGLPQVICPGAIEVLVFGPPETVPAPYNRPHADPPQPADHRRSAQSRGDDPRWPSRSPTRLQHTKDEAVFMIPTAGYDSYAVKGQGLLRSRGGPAPLPKRSRPDCPRNIKVVERDTHIDDPAFATEAANTLIRLIKSKQKA